MYMKKQFIILSESWTPSRFYDDKTELVWVNTYDLFVKLYENTQRIEKGIKYAIHKDVYRAFRHMYREKQSKKSNRKTRKIKNKNK